MKMHAAWVVVLATACGSPSASATPGGAQAAPAPSTPVAPTPAKPLAPADEFSDVGPSGQKTSTGSDVIAVGVPRFELVEGKGFGPLALRARAGTVFAQDGRWISIWSAGTGAPLRHIAPRVDAPNEPSASLAVSSDGEWLATGSSYKVRLFQRPFEQPAAELGCYDALAFSHDGKLLACRTTALGIWDLAKRQLVAPLPASAPKDWPAKVVFTPDSRSLVWTTERALLRWDFAGGGSVATIYQAPARIEHAAIAAGGSAAYVLAAGKAVVVDVATGKTSPAVAQFGTAISPSGQRLAAGMPGALQVSEVATGKALWSAKLAAPVTRIAFGETDDALVYVEARHLRVAAMPGAPAAAAQPSRFAGWLGSGIAAIEHGATLRAFTLATRAWAPADRAALATKPLDGAPSWAHWVAETPGDRSIAAEPSKRHELAPDMRGGEPCDPRLRVWTKAGGTKTLTMACSKPEMDDHEDPGWLISGGWAVGLSATAATIYEPRTGRRVATLKVPTRKNSHPEFAPAYWQAAIAPSGDWLAIIWRRAELQGSQTPGAPDAREDAAHLSEAAFTADCVNGDHGCQLEYFAELWTLKGAPKRVWQARLERSIPERGAAEPAAPSGVLTFDSAGSQLLIGFDDGQIRLVPTAAPAGARTEHLHRASIRALSLDPNGVWVFSADSAGEERLWMKAP